MRKVVLLFVAVVTAKVCYDLKDVKSSVCWAMCRNDSYDTGSYDSKTDDCLCSNKTKFKDMTKIIIKIQTPRPEKELLIYDKD